ncbi:hypothetical protein RND81_11G095500 [Saponaria officinalis]|uniref:Retrotransposon gag domain-containing protein n=1 Tax=Saponaria officinalis TaxID=3572 RepID=A0AAW1HLQ4_SAPOF
MTMQGYTDKFNELSRFAGYLILTEADKIQRYERRMTPKIRAYLAGIPSTTFQQAYDRALAVYEAVEAENATRNRFGKRPFTPSSSFSNAPKKPNLVTRPP